MHCLNCKQEMTNYVIHTPLLQLRPGNRILCLRYRWEPTYSEPLYPAKDYRNVRRHYRKPDGVVCV